MLLFVGLVVLAFAGLVWGQIYLSCVVLSETAPKAPAAASYWAIATFDGKLKMTDRALQIWLRDMPELKWLLGSHPRKAPQHCCAAPCVCTWLLEPFRKNLSCGNRSRFP